MNTLERGQKPSHLGLFTSQRSFHTVKDTNETENCFHVRRISHLLSVHNERFHCISILSGQLGILGLIVLFCT